MVIKLTTNFNNFLQFFQAFSLFVPYSIAPKHCRTFHYIISINLIVPIIETTIFLHFKTIHSNNIIEYICDLFQMLSPIFAHFMMTLEAISNRTAEIKMLKIIQYIENRNLSKFNKIIFTKCRVCREYLNVENFRNESVFHQKFVVKFIVGIAIGIITETYLTSYIYYAAPKWSEGIYCRWWSLNVTRFSMFHWIMYVDWMTEQFTNIDINLEKLSQLTRIEKCCQLKRIVIDAQLNEQRRQYCRILLLMKLCNLRFRFSILWLICDIFLNLTINFYWILCRMHVNYYHEIISKRFFLNI